MGDETKRFSVTFKAGELFNFRILPNQGDVVEDEFSFDGAEAAARFCDRLAMALAVKAVSGGFVIPGGDVNFPRPSKPPSSIIVKAPDGTIHHARLDGNLYFGGRGFPVAALLMDIIVLDPAHHLCEIRSDGMLEVVKKNVSRTAFYVKPSDRPSPTNEELIAKIKAGRAAQAADGTAEPSTETERAETWRDRKPLF